MKLFKKAAVASMNKLTGNLSSVVADEDGYFSVTGYCTNSPDGVIKIIGVFVSGNRPNITNTYDNTYSTTNSYTSALYIPCKQSKYEEMKALLLGTPRSANLYIPYDAGYGANSLSLTVTVPAPGRLRMIFSITV